MSSLQPANLILPPPDGNNGKIEVDEDEVAGWVRSPKHFYELLLRNQYLMPDFKSTIITMPWMMDVRNGDIPIPKTDQVQYRNCATPPTKEILIKECQKAVNHELGIKKWKQPDIPWLILFLSTCNPNHRFFDRAYTYRKQQSKQ